MNGAIYLGIAIVGEVIATSFLRASAGFTQLVPTIVVVVGYGVTFYFFSGWLPKLMSDLGYSTPDAIRTSAMMSLGGVIGGSALGWAAPRLGLVRLVMTAMIGTTVTFVAFGMVSGLAALQAISFIAGACVGSESSDAI